MQHGQLHHHFFKTLDLPQLPSPIWSGPKQSDFGECSENFPWELLLSGIHVAMIFCILITWHSILVCFYFFHFSPGEEQGWVGGCLQHRWKAVLEKMILKADSQSFIPVSFFTLQNFLWFPNFQVELRVFYPPVTAPPEDWKVSSSQSSSTYSLQSSSLSSSSL